MQKIRLFVSSPTDVAAERRRVDNVVNRIQADYEGMEFEVIRWEESFYTARSTFQDQITSPADVDIVLCILWKRLGSPLPDDYRRPDGSTPTGTEYEFETAMEAALSGELPDILVYRKTQSISFSADHVEQEQAELQSLESFWRRWIQNEKGHFTAGFKPFEQTDEFEQQLEKDLRAWLKRRFHHVTWPESKGSPYRGLDVFDEEHAPIYFGRRRAINEVRARLIANEQRDGIGFLLIIGASGAGKSSLVRAGLIPALKESNPLEGVAGWRTLVLRPTELGADPVHGLVSQLYETSVLPELLEGDYQQPKELSELWTSSPALAARPIESALQRWGKTLTVQEQFSTDADTRLLITIDQFEEIFLFETEQQVAFLNVIDSLSRSGKIWIIATMRSDFYPQLFSQPELLALKDASRQYDLSIPRAHELQEIITGPASAAGLSFEHDESTEGLEQKLLEDAETNPSALPLLEFTLERLYQERDREKKMLTFSAYEQLGGLKGALTQTAEETFTRIQKRFTDNSENIFARVMRELIAIDDQGKATRRVASYARFTTNADDQLLVDTLLESRLLTGYTAETSLSTQAEAVVNITHEALIHHWDRMQHWLEKDQELLQVRERIAQDCQRWLIEFKRRDMLATTGKRLEDIRYLKNSGLLLDNETTDFINASLTRAKQLQKRKRLLQASFSAVSISAAIFGVITLNSLDELSLQKEKIREKEQVLINSQADSTGLIAEAEYAKANLFNNQQDNISAFNSYYKAINRARESGQIRRGKLAAEEDQRSSKDQAFDPNWLSNIFRQSTWHLTALNKNNQLTDGSSYFPLVSPNKKTAIIITNVENADRSASLYRLKDKKRITGPLPTNLLVGQSTIFGTAFSPDSQHLALIVENTFNVKNKRSEKTYSLKVIDTVSGAMTDKTITEMSNDLHVCFLNNNQLVVSDNQQNSVRLWDMQQSQRLTDLTPIIHTDVRIHKLDAITDNILQLNNNHLWRQQSSGEWENIATLEDINPFNLNGSKPAPVIYNSQIVNVVSKYDSWLPNWLLDLISLSLSNSYGTSSWITNLSLIKIRPQFAVTRISEGEVTTEYIDIQLPKAIETSAAGYASFSTLLQRYDKNNTVLFVVAFLNLEGDEDTYSYKLNLADTISVDPPKLVIKSKSYDFKLITGAARIGEDSVLFSASNGELYERYKDNNPIQIRPDDGIFGLADTGSEIIMATKSGTYLLPKNLLSKNSTSNKFALTDTAKQVFYKYQNIYKTQSALPKIYFNDEKNVVQLYHPHQEVNQENRSRRRETNKDIVLKPIKLNDIDMLNRSNILSSVILNKKAIGDRHPFSILAANTVPITPTNENKTQTIITNQRISTENIKQVSLAANSEHYTTLSEDNHLHILSMGNDRLMKEVGGFKSSIRKIATGTIDVAATDTRGKINIISINSNNRTSFTISKKIKTMQAIQDNGKVTTMSKQDLQAVNSAIEWHPTQPLLAIANWQGSFHIIPSETVEKNRLPATSAMHRSRAAISTLKWNPDGSNIVSADRNGIANIWTVQQVKNKLKISHAAQLKHDSSVTALTYSNDGQWLITATDTDKLYFWRADGTALGEPLALQDIQIRNVHINDDNWGVIIIAKDGTPHFLEAGDRFIPNRIMSYFDLLTKDELFKQQAGKIQAKDNSNIIDYYRNPPITDRTFWTVLANQLSTCEQQADCKNSKNLENYFMFTPEQVYGARQ